MHIIKLIIAFTLFSSTFALPVLVKRDLPHPPSGSGTLQQLPSNSGSGGGGGNSGTVVRPLPPLPRTPPLASQGSTRQLPSTPHRQGFRPLPKPPGSIEVA